MPSPPPPANEKQRLAALHALDILDTPATDVFDSFVRVARSLFQAPISAISLIDWDRQWFKAVEGMPARKTPRSISFCAHAILQPDAVLCVPDARLDARFADNPMVQGEPKIRFYAGAPLTGEHGEALGALCVIDREPRAPSATDLARLRDIATGASAALRLHGTLRRLARGTAPASLNGLGNQREFEAALAQVAGECATLFMLHLDNFGGVKDVFGQVGGDLALREVAKRLRGTSRGHDQPFHLGGDAFALIAQRMPTNQARLSLAGRLHAALSDSFLIDGRNVPLRGAIGIATLPSDATTRNELIQLANTALCEARRAGRGATCQVQRVPTAAPA